MIITRVNRIRSITGSILLMSAILLSYGVVPVQAGILKGYVQARYDLLETKEEGKSVVSQARLTTNYYLALRKPLTPYANLMSDLSLNSSDTIEQIGIQSNRDLRFNVYAAGSRYNFTGRISRGDSVSSSRVLCGVA
ncbi:MAG: hypothetical protein ACYC0V_21055, partial [Armatimonadota bacterium]